MYKDIYKTYKKVSKDNVNRELFDHSKESPKDTIEDIKNNKLVIYTAFTGDYDTLKQPEVIDENCDYICFTDNPDITSDFWEIRLMDESTLDNNRKAKQYKVLPHKYFPEYKYSFWLDGTFKIKGSIREYIYRFITANSPILCVVHTERDCIYDELDASKVIPRYPRLVMEEQINKYKKDGFPKNYGLPVLGAILREHNNPKIIKLMEDWWAENIKFSNQDQLSFGYVAWKNNIHPSVARVYYWDNEYWAKEGEYHHKIILGNPVTSDNLRAKIGEEVDAMNSHDTINLKKEELYLLVNDVKGLISHDFDKGGRIGYNNGRINSIVNSNSFKITKPLRRTESRLKKNPFFRTIFQSKLNFKKYLDLYKQIKASGIFNEEEYKKIHIIDDYEPIMHFIYYSSKSDDINTKNKYINSIFDLNFYINAYNIGDEDPIIHYFSKGFFNDNFINNNDYGFVNDLYIDFNYQYEKYIDNKITEEISLNNYITDPEVLIYYMGTDKVYDTNTIKVGVFLEDSFVNMNACPYLRLHGPLKELSKNKDFHFFIYGKEVLPVINGDDFLKVKSFDIIIVQRISPYLDIFNEKAKEHGIKVIYETDDDLLNLSEEHPASDYIHSHFKSLKNFANEADAITVSTNELFLRFSKFKNVNLIKNYFANDILKFSENTNEPSNTIKIGYFGTFTHYADLILIKNVILIIKHNMAKMGINVEFEVVGGLELNEEVWINRIELPFYPMAIDTFYGWLEQKINWDIGLIPLFPSDFNRCKSELKYIEFTAIGVPTVSSDINAYVEAIDDGVNGFLASSEEEWVSKIENLILDKNLRDTTLNNARKDVLINYRLDSRVKQWDKILKDLSEG